MSGPVEQYGPSVWNRGTGAAVNQPPVRSASFPFTLILPVWLSRYHYSYSVEPHKRKEPCTKPADPQHTYKLGSKNRIYLLVVLKSGNVEGRLDFYHHKMQNFYQ
ncbi:hypothetical protein T10_7742 [Trichinella papuae]|uniref:Uncharacterized protein n=1 Tax=Trichinella papuae TaxID=268474 RepID=A0A0V1MQT2_9BILA|nr:hypothetical protein T10_7742 [Trichinella papuae]